MTVTLNIQNDAELRAYIKECIKGQVIAVTREQITELIIEEIKGKIKGLDSARTTNHLNTAFREYVKTEAANNGLAFYSKEAFREQIALEVTRHAPNDSQLNAMFITAVHNIASAAISKLTK